MIEIVPNWHPVLVHFTVALLIVAPLLFFASTWLPLESPAKLRLLAAARYNLLLGFIASLGTVAAGWYAANTVAHHEAAHAAMLTHRNLALVTVVAYTPFVIWTLMRGHGPRSHGLLFAVLLFLPMVSLTVTAWRGGELVYVHGLGVQSLPDAGGQSLHGHGESSHAAAPEPGHAETGTDGADHDHGQENAHDEAPQP